MKTKPGWLVYLGDDILPNYTQLCGDYNEPSIKILITLLETNMSPEKSSLKMIFLFPRWDMLVP